MRRPVVYVSIEGVLGHLGFSQVFRIVEGLAKRGRPYALVTLERSRDLEDDSRLSMVRRRAKEAGIDWSFGVYREGGSAQTVTRNQAVLSALTIRMLGRHRPATIHARAYHSGMIALGLQPLVQGRWVFDARGYWIDERLEEGRWFTTPARLAVARAVERQLFSRSAAVVTLTQLQAGDIVAGGFGVPRGRVEVIPTCADFEEFTPRRVEDLTAVPSETRRRLAGRRVLGIVGSLNRAYLGPATAQLARLVTTIDPAARVLVLSGQLAAWRSELERAGVPDEAVEYATVPHEKIPHWINLLTWALLLLTPETRAKRAMMPTKLAEFFASGVRVCAHGCNSEVAAWVRETSEGAVLEDVSVTSLETAAQQIAASSLGPCGSSRELARSHFSLERGLDRYERLLDGIT